MTEPLLRLEGVTKKFGASVALDNVTLEVFPNEVVGLVGENGAGKSTLLKALAGIHRIDSGRIVMAGRERSFRSASDARRAGVGMVFQEQSLIPTLTVAENMYLGNEGKSVRLGVYRWAHLRARAAKQLAKVGSSVATGAITERLPFSVRQMVEIGKALLVEENTASQPLILLDEPTAVLETEDVAVLFAEIARLKTLGSIVLISHRLEEVLEISDRIYVMRDGQLVAERKPAECTHRELFQLMVGEEPTGEYYKQLEQKPHTGEVVMSARSLSLEGSFEDINFELHKGEVLGLAGVEGSGRDELCRTLFGAEAPTSGELVICGEPTTLSSPAEAVSRGLGYIPAERMTEGIVPELSIADNISLSYSGGVQRGPFRSRKAERKLGADWIRRLSIKAQSSDTTVGDLSGGNQQKVALAKWLNRPHLQVLILDHPTRGLDVGAKRDVYQLIRELAHTGVGILLIGDSLEETIGLSHNVVSMRDGRITGVFAAPPTEKPTQVEILERLV